MASNPETGPVSAGVHELEQQRRKNRDEAARLGFLPYGKRVDGLLTLAAAKGRYDEAADKAFSAAGKEPPAGFTDPRARVAVSGRIVLLRDNGKLLWLTLRDDSGDMQAAVSQRDCDERSFALAKLLDLGDVVVVRGRVMKTKTGEVTCWAGYGRGSCRGRRSGGRTLEQVPDSPPEKHAGLADVELRYRRRYVDMWATPETVRVFQLRSRIIARIRRYLDERGYLEVETPMLQQLAGGAAARPFKTHMNALDIELFLRIAPELYLKRLLVGGLPRVYEINRNFRNEGLDKSHNPEFTMIEVYHAFGDVETMMELIEGSIRACAVMVKMASDDASGKVAEEDSVPDDLRLPFGETMIDYGKPFLRVSYSELFERALGFPMTDGARAREEAKKRGLKITGEKGEPLAGRPDCQRPVRGVRRAEAGRHTADVHHAVPIGDQPAHQA